MRYKKSTKIAMLSLCCVVIGLIILFIYNSISINQPLDANVEDINKTALIDALESYYGEWEIAEDYGYHGTHRMTEIEVFEVGKSIFFREDALHYEDSINVLYPDIMIEITSSAKMQQVDRMEYPHQMGFDNQYAQYAKIIIYDYQSSSNVVCSFYILNDDEIILEGDVHRYYRAMRKN